VEKVEPNLALRLEQRIAGQLVQKRRRRLEQRIVEKVGRKLAQQLE
jgi:hypothetical protein